MMCNRNAKNCKQNKSIKSMGLVENVAVVVFVLSHFPTSEPIFCSGYKKIKLDISSVSFFPFVSMHSWCKQQKKSTFFKTKKKIR